MRYLSAEECKHWRAENSRRREWKHQLTCVTPLQRLPWFASMLVRHLEPSAGALLVVDQLVFDVPPALAALRCALGETRSLEDAPGQLFETGEAGLSEALAAALSGWIDLRVLCSPSCQALRADHDEYTTFFSTSAGRIATLRDVLRQEGVQLAEYVASAP